MTIRSRIISTSKALIASTLLGAIPVDARAQSSPAPTPTAAAPVEVRSEILAVSAEPSVNAVRVEYRLSKADITADGSLRLTLALGSNSEAIMTGPLEIGTPEKAVGIKVRLVQLSKEQVQQLRSRHKDGVVPSNARIIFTGTSGGSRAREIASFSKSLPLLFPESAETTNGKFRVGVLPVTPASIDLSKVSFCLALSDLGERGFEFSGTSEDCTETLARTKHLRPSAVRSISVTDLLFGTTKVTDVDNVLDYQTMKRGTAHPRSLRYLGEFWNELLKRHGLETTRYGRIAMTTTILRPVEISAYPDLPKDPRLAQLATEYFLRDAVARRQTELDAFDLVLFVNLGISAEDSGSSLRPFSAGKYGFVGARLDLESSMMNGAFLGSAQVVGASLFHLPFRWTSRFQPRYPDGVPDPSDFPQKKFCLMGIWTLATSVSDAPDRKVSTDPSVSSRRPPFLEEEADNAVLCAADIATLAPHAIPDGCPIEAFYDSRCDCKVGWNYTSCR